MSAFHDVSVFQARSVPIELARHQDQDETASSGTEALLPVLRSAEKIADQAYKDTIQTGRDEMSEDELNDLSNSYGARIPDSPRFNPEQFPAHRQISDGISAGRKLIGERVDFRHTMEEGLRHAAPAAEAPEPHTPAFKLVSACALWVAFGPTIYSVVIRMLPDPVLAWAFSLLFGLMIAAFLVLSILDDVGRETSMGPFLFGATLAAAFCLLRLALGAQPLDAAAYLLFEISVIGVLEIKARRWRARQAQFERAAAEHQPFLEQIERCDDEISAAAEELQRYEAQIAEIGARACDGPARELLTRVAKGSIIRALQHNKSVSQGKDHQSVLGAIRRRAASSGGSTQ